MIQKPVTELDDRTRERLVDDGWREGTIMDVRDLETTWSIDWQEDGWAHVGGGALRKEDIPDGVIPARGDRIRWYLHEGAVIMGADLNGVNLFYRTKADRAEMERQQRRDWEEEKRAEFHDRRDELDEAFDRLPDCFQRRIVRFRENNPEFRWKFEAYELFVCSEAVKIADALRAPLNRTDGSKEASQAVFDRFLQAGEKEWERVAGIAPMHTENSFPSAMRLAWLYVNEPEDVVLEHGALSPVVGSEEYGDVERKRELTEQALLDDLDERKVTVPEGWTLVVGGGRLELVARRVTTATAFDSEGSPVESPALERLRVLRVVRDEELPDEWWELRGPGAPVGGVVSEGLFDAPAEKPKTRSPLDPE